MKNLLYLALLAVACASLMPGQQPKTDEEYEAVLAIQSAATPEARIAAADNLITNFTESDFVELAYAMMMASYQQLGDFENMMVYGERALEVNPNSPGVLLELANAIPLRTREFDLDKEEKLSKAEDFATRALNIIPTMPKMNPDIPDDQWLVYKKDFMSRGNEALGLVASKRNEHDQAAELFQKAIELAPEPTAQSYYYLANAQHAAGNKEGALAAVNRSIELGGIPGTTIVQTLKQEIEAAE